MKQEAVEVEPLKQVRKLLEEEAGSYRSRSLEEAIEVEHLKKRR